MILGGYNNKHYDDYILLAMLNGADNLEIKRFNDYIIGGGEPWKWDFVRGMRKPFHSFDLRDDVVDKGLSLKAIEGNMLMNIVESGVSFDIDRALTEDELRESVEYCKTDVDSTVALYKAREDYVGAKRLISETYDVPIGVGMGYTNAKLCARILDAKKQPHDDEREYRIPDCIDLEDIPKPILEFFMQIHDKSIASDVLFKTSLEVEMGGCPITYAWGGVHGAIPNYIAEATEDDLIQNDDVASMYPNCKLNFGYVSRNCKDPEAYRKLVQARLKAKREGNKPLSNALKLPINTAYGAMLNQYNDLYDPLQGRSVCITNQLAMTDLVVKLIRNVPSFRIINFNTDGVMYHIRREHLPIADEIFDEWQRRIGFELERDHVQKIIQKDVNGYIALEGNEIKCKGGYVSMYKIKDGEVVCKGDFKNNSLAIVQRATVDFLLYGIPVEETIGNCDNIFDFQMIMKTGSTYGGTVHEVNGEYVPVQRVNRVYATHNPKYGSLYKVKGERRDKVANCPERAIIDNANELTVKDIDKSFYIELTKGRINDFLIGKKKTKKKKVEVIEIMAKATEKSPEFNGMNVYQKLEAARKMFAEKKIDKSGINRHAGFKYYTLDDIIPEKIRIFEQVGLCDFTQFNERGAMIRVVNVDNVEEHIDFTSSLAEDESMIRNPIQKLGAVQTYVRRYLHLMMLDIVEPETVDAISGQDESKTPAKKAQKPATSDEREKAKETITDANGNADEAQIKAIKAGLKKYRDTVENADEVYIKDTIKRIKGGLTKTEAEDLLIEIGEKLA